MTDAAQGGFGLLDWSLVIACAAVLLGIGWYYARRQRTTEEYFVAGRNKRPFLAGVSLFAALFTLVAYLGIPGEFVQNGPVLVVATVCVLPFTYVAVGWLLIPLIMRLPITSAYELLEGRLGRSVRLMGSLTFVCIRLVWMALILYAASTVLVNVMGCDRRWLHVFEAVIGAVATVYTVVGGIDAVMMTAAVEFFLLLLGAVLTLVSISVHMGGVGAWWPTQWPQHWAPQPFFSLDPHVRVTVVGTFVSYFISMICSSGSDQVAIQRYLTTRDAAAARRADLCGHLSIASVMILLGLVGAALLGFFQHQAGGLSAGLALARNGDGAFPYYISHHLPAGISGLVVAGLLASAVSGVSPGINSVIAVLSRDVIDPMRSAGTASERTRMRTARLLSAVIGVVVIAGSLGMGQVRGNLIEVSAKTTNLFFYPMFGLFFMAMFVRFATPLGAIAGALYSMTAAILVGYWDVLTGHPRPSFQWIPPVALATSLVAGCLFSLLPTRGRPPAVVAACAVAALAPLPLIVAWILSRA